MEGTPQLLKIAGCENARRQADVIFVHGLDGDARTTWHPQEQPTHFWPAWLGEDCPQLGVWSLGYAVSASAWKGHSMPLYDRADNTLDLLDLDGIGQRPLAFVCHSLGGLLIKQALRNAIDAHHNPHWQAIARQTWLIVFLSTPHSGASMANWIQYLGKLLRTTVSVAELEAHHPRLRELNNWYRDHVESLGIQTFVYYEKLPTTGLLVVDETTANPGIPGVRPIPVDEDHRSICKPASREVQIYRRVKRLLEDTVLHPESGNTPAATGPSIEAHRRYYQECVTRWSHERYALDKRFVHLTLLVDRAEDGPGPRWQPGSETFHDLAEVLAHVSEQAVVVLGPPGSGKSTLLRHFELDCARAALAEQTGHDLRQAPLTFFVPLNDFKPARDTHRLPLPKDWLAAQWATRYRELPALETCLQEQRLTLLLDALNEMPAAGTEPVQLWRDFLGNWNRPIQGTGWYSPAARWITVSCCRPESVRSGRCASSPYPTRRSKSSLSSIVRTMAQRCGRT
jgi:NACHT domain